MPLAVWLVSLGSVFLVGFAAGRASRRPVVVHFPEWTSVTRLEPTSREVAAAIRSTDDAAQPAPGARPTPEEAGR